VARVELPGDDATLREALESASIPCLVPVVVLLTGDPSLLRRGPRPDPGRIGDTGGGLPEDFESEVRARAFEVIRAYRDEKRELPPLPADEMLCEIMSWCVGEPVAPEYLPVVMEEIRLDGRDRRRFEWRKRPADEVLQSFHVLIIGAGLAGVCAAIRLAEAGIPYTIIEKNDNVGGTWLENTYPDCRVDVANHFYSYSFEPNPDWSDFYARRDELEAYVERCADKYGVRPKIRFETEVVSARYDEDRARWQVRVRGKGGNEEALEVNAVISGVGMLNRPHYPEIEGLERFAGPMFHSARWEHEHDLRGKRVAVIGTGASAMQFVPVIAQQTERLLVFQRSPQWAVPNPNYHRQVSEAKKWLLHHVPYYASWYRLPLMWNVADRMYPSFCKDPDWDQPEVSLSAANDALRVMLTEHIKSEIGDDPELLAKALPDYPPLGKRILMDNGWFRTMRRDDVDLITDPIREFTRDAIVTEKGDRYPVDVIIPSTGFHAGKFLWPMEITGRSGVKLGDLWDGGENPRAYLGITIPGFPNFFCLYGPNTNPVVGSVIFMIECQVRYTMGCLREILEGGIEALDCRQEVHDAYNERLDAQHEKLVWRHPRVHSYYNNAQGRVTTNLAWRLIDYWRMTLQPDLSDYVPTASE
jgi:4-hydroxyacetophenone monooxygenase